MSICFRFFGTWIICHVNTVDLAFFLAELWFLLLKLNMTVGDLKPGSQSTVCNKKKGKFVVWLNQSLSPNLRVKTNVKFCFIYNKTYFDIVITFFVIYFQKLTKSALVKSITLWNNGKAIAHLSLKTLLLMT